MGNGRVFAFARERDPITGRFWSAKDPEYEYSE